MRSHTQRHSELIADLKGRIVKQREFAAKLCREGRRTQAKDARTKLLNLLHQLDLLQERGAVL